MKTYIRKTAASLFLLLGLSPLFLAFSFTAREYFIQQRMRKMLESHDLQTVVVAERDLVWMDDHEIWVNGSMFDIRTKSYSNGVYTFTGMYDAEETELVRQQMNLGDENSESTLFISKLIGQLHSLYNEEPFTMLICRQAGHHPASPGALLENLPGRVPTPPPDVPGSPS